MTIGKRWGRVLRVFGVTVLVLIAGLAAFVQIQQHILRWRAERLLADIREIQMGKSTWADAQRLMYKWGAWGDARNECTERSCDYVISIDDMSHAYHHFPLLWGGQSGNGSWLPHWLMKPYAWAGGRFVVMEARFEVVRGLVRSKEFGVMAALYPTGYDSAREPAPSPDAAILAATTCAPGVLHWRSLDWSALPRLQHNSVEDPEMSLFLEDDSQGHFARAQYTPFANEETVRSLFDFNLDCITRGKDCRTAAEVMPGAESVWNSFKTGIRKDESGEYPKALPLWRAARDAEFVAIAEILPIPKGGADRQSPDTRVLRIEKLLKGPSGVSDSGPYMVDTVGSSEVCQLSPEEQKRVDSREKVVLIFDEPLNELSTPESERKSCAVAPLGQQSLSDVQRGIERDSILKAE
jgi:hypothetical protein